MSCTETNIQQTLFLGASIKGFQCSLGLNGQTSTLTVSVVEDNCGSHPRIYWDKNLTQQTWTGPDPGFLGKSYVLAGLPIYFRMGDFEHSGIIQGWVEKTSVDGQYYEITIVDPREILAGAQCIISSYTGAVNIPNLFNVYGFLEQFGTPCTDAPPGGFGGSEINDGGIRWNYIRQALSVMTSSIPSNISNYSPFGRLLFRGVDYAINPGFGIVAGNEYLLDLSDVPFAPSYWRMGGSNISVLEAIDQVCEDSGCDYYVELVHLPYNNSLYKIIKIRTVSRILQPVLGQIASFIGNSAGTTSTEKGEELRNETTAAFLTGGDKTTIYEVESDYEEDGSIWPFWGIDDTFTPLLGEGINNNHTVTVDARVVGIPGLTYYTLTVFEIRAALASEEVWMSVAGAINPEAQRIFGLNGRWNADNAFLLQLINLNAVRGEDILNGQKAALEQAEFNIHHILINRLYEFIRAYGEQFYGRKFLVKIPFICSKTESETFRILWSKEPTDAGWIDFNSNILGAENPYNIDAFRSQDGRLECFVRFNNVETLNTSNLNPSDAFVEGDYLFVRATIDQNVFVLNNIPRVVLTLNSPMFLYNEELLDGEAIEALIVLLGKALGAPDLDPNIIGKNAAEKFLNKSSLQQAFWGLYPTAVQPDAVAVPLKSNTETYGPWYRSFGKPGKVRYESNTSLVPWEYGTSDIMNAAGQSLVDSTVTNMQVGEMGAIDLPGLPLLPLGAELRWGGQSLFELRNLNLGNLTFSNGDDFDFGSLNDISAEGACTWAGQFGPNITNIDVTIDPQSGIRSSYRFRTYTPKFGIFSKNAADYLRRVGQTQQKFRRMFSSLSRPFPPTFFGDFHTKIRNWLGGIEGNRQLLGRSPHSVFIGDVISANGEKRPHVQSQELYESFTDLAKDYSNKAFMGFDGLLRPFQTTGGSAANMPAVPSVPEDNTGNGQDNLYPVLPVKRGQIINAKSLNPFKHAGDGPYLATKSHDIENIARGTSLPSHINVRFSGHSSTTYRGMALRGPVMIAGWGFDIYGKPVPRASDTADSFNDDWLQNYDTWKVGPLDVRWDDRRGVWTAPPGYRLAVCTLQGNLEIGGSCTALLDDTDIDGIQQQIRIVDKTDHPVASGSKAIVTYNPEASVTGEYYIVTAQYRPLCITTDVDCSESGLVVFQRTIYLDSAWSVESRKIDDDAASEIPASGNCAASGGFDW